MRDAEVIVDIPSRRLTLLASEEEIARCGDAWQPPDPKVRGGWLARYAAVPEPEPGRFCVFRAVP